MPDQRNARDAEAAAANTTPDPQLVVHAVNITPPPSTRMFVPQPSSSSSSRRARSSSGGGGDNNNNAPTQSQVETPTTTNTTNITTTVNTTTSTNTTINTTQPTNQTNTTAPPANNTNNTLPPTNTTITPPPVINTTNSTPVLPPVNSTPPVVNTTPPPPPPAALAVTLTVESGFPQDQNVVFQCKADGVTEFDWDFDHGRDRNTDGTVFHTFPESGTYTVECEAKKGNQVGKATKTVTVAAPKKVDNDYPYAAMLSASGEGTTRTFTCEDVGFTASTYRWLIDGGPYDSVVAGVNAFDDGAKTLTHTFPESDEYDIYCEAVTFDDRMSRAFWEEGRVCNNARGCTLAADSIEIEIEVPEEEQPNEGETDQQVPEQNNTQTNSTSSTDLTVEIGGSGDSDEDDDEEE